MHEADINRLSRSNVRNPAVDVFRWIALLPSCIVAALLSSILFKILGNFSLSFVFVESGSPLRLVIAEWGANIIFGVVQVYVAALIAPRYRKQTAVVIVGLNLLLSGAALLVFFGHQAFLGIAGTVAMNIGAIAMAIMIFKEKIRFS